MVKVCEVPLQPLASGITVIAESIVELPLFKGVNVPILPTPVAGNPMLVLLFVQL